MDQRVGLKRKGELIARGPSANESLAERIVEFNIVSISDNLNGHARDFVIYPHLSSPLPNLSMYHQVIYFHGQRKLFHHSSTQRLREGSHLLLEQVLSLSPHPSRGAVLQLE